MSHRLALAIRFADVDPAGIVYFPRYFHFCHVGMEEYFASVVGVPYPELIARHGLGLPAVKSEAEHRLPLRYGDAVEHEVEVTRVGSSSVEWRHRFRPAGGEAVATECRIVTVLVEMSGFRKVALPDWLKERLRSI